MNCRSFLVAALLLPLAGCASRWVEPVRVLSAGPDTITVQWNGIEVSQAAARRKAVLHCGVRHAVEVEGGARRSGSALGMARSKAWRCVDP